MKKRKPDTRKEGREFSPTEVGSLLEEIRQDVKLIAEGHTGLDQKLEKVDAGLQTLDKRVERVEIAVHGNSRRIDSLDLSSQTQNLRLDYLEDAVSKLGKDLAEAKTELKKDIHDLGKVRMVIPAEAGIHGSSGQAGG